MIKLICPKSTITIHCGCLEPNDQANHSFVVHATADEVEAAHLERDRLVTVRDQAENQRHVASYVQQLAVCAEARVDSDQSKADAVKDATDKLHLQNVARESRAVVVKARRFVQVVVQRKDGSVLTKAYDAVETARAALDAAIKANAKEKKREPAYKRWIDADGNVKGNTLHSRQAERDRAALLAKLEKKKAGAARETKKSTKK